MNRSDLHALQTFLAIADQGSLRAAARVLGVNPPAISHQLKNFEDRLGTPLFVRTTRSVTLTDAGQTLYDGSRYLLGAIQDTVDNTRNAAQAKTGQLRITLPFRAWQLIVAPKLAGFQDTYPGIELDLTIEESLTDIIQGGFHAGIRLGDHLQENMIATRLSATEEAAYIASPRYLEKHGTPNRPQDLLTHHCIRHRWQSSGRIATWQFTGTKENYTVSPQGGLIFNDLRSVVDAASRGFGIGWSLKRGVQEDLDTDRLVQVLADYTPMRPGFFLYFSKPLRSLRLLRVFIEHFRAT
ncbi:LysR family transcriptional regulator [Hwanghaeella sp. LZ110]|uniref:LysR family transcriptional regulator n=1 Tax=Hwanghaeella sp. LZ110 TaxID=3402810 RepID=UPI003B67C734